VANVSDLTDDVIYEVVNRFLGETGAGKKRKVKEIAAAVSALKGVPLSREDIYPILAEARRRGLLKVCPPIDIVLAQRIADSYGLSVGEKLGEPQVQVVDFRGPGATEAVAIQVALKAVRIIMKIGERKGVVHIGLASGFTAMRIATHLADLLRREKNLPHLVFHSLSGGYSPFDPQKASVTFFSMFYALPTKVDFVALFAPPFVPTGEYEGIGERVPGVKEAFALKHQIDLVITSFASRKDEDGELRKFIDAMPKEGPGGGKPGRTPEQIGQDLIAIGWIGDIQYRPYSSERPLNLTEAEVPYAAVTLFNLRELVELAAREDKAVILAGPPCMRCGRSRHDALDPLLRNPALRVWSHVIMDAETADKLVRPAMVAR
jgi:hypothetical protein